MEERSWGKKGIGEIRVNEFYLNDISPLSLNPYIPNFTSYNELNHIQFVIHKIKNKKQ